MNDISPDAYVNHGLQLVDLERVKALTKGYTPTHDMEHHSVQELSRIATCYMDYAVNQIEEQEQDEPHPFWPEGTTIPWNPKEEPWETFVMAISFGLAALDLAIALANEEPNV